MIDVRDIMKGNYPTLYKLDREEFLNEKRERVGEKEVNALLTEIVCGVPDIIQSTLEYSNSVDKFLLVIPRIRSNIFDREKQKTAQRMNYIYRDIHDFLNKDPEGIQEMLGLKKIKIPPEKMPAYLDCMREIAIDCVEFCLDKFRRDIEDYMAENHVTWAQKVEVAQIVDRKHHEGQNIKKRGFEDLQDNEGNRVKWRTEIESRKARKTNKENEVLNV